MEVSGDTFSLWVAEVLHHENDWSETKRTSLVWPDFGHCRCLSQWVADSCTIRAGWHTRHETFAEASKTKPSERGSELSLRHITRSGELKLGRTTERRVSPRTVSRPKAAGRASRRAQRSARLWVICFPITPRTSCQSNRDFAVPSFSSHATTARTVPNPASLLEKAIGTRRPPIVPLLGRRSGECLGKRIGSNAMGRLPEGRLCSLGLGLCRPGPDPTTSLRRNP